MMSLATIKEMNRKATREARSELRRPFVPNEAQRAVLADGEVPASVRIPFLADYVPKGWRMVNANPWFVDTSGFGRPGEPAMTIEDMCRRIAVLPEGHGVAMIEHGQFQGYLAVYKPTKPRAKKPV